MDQVQVVYLAGGCFWGLEELFKHEHGVTETEVGYCGGSNDNPTYEYHPGHAETVAVYYDPSKTSLDKLLDFFFRVHDPTTLNRQGNDKGSSYRSAIFYTNESELKIAQSIIDKVNASGLYKDPVVTSLEKYKQFFLAEDYHQDYLEKHPGGYTCHYLRTDASFI
jgi:peptide-methionine (S)-S-oxide reductase